jgi:hypothetical protein
MAQGVTHRILTADTFVPSKASPYEIFHGKNDISTHVSESKGSPLQALAASWGSDKLRLPDFLIIQHYEGGKVVIPRNILVLILRG